MTDTVRIDEFLAASLRALRAGEDARWALPAGTDPGDVWECIEYHGIAVLLHAHGERLAGWPAPLIERMAEEARLLGLWETTHHQSVSELVSALHKEGIESVLLKGTALAYSLHDDPANRRRGDTDLLIHPRYKQQARAVFERLGWYLREAPHGLYYQEGWLHDAAGFFKHLVDLHWEPADRPVLQRILPLDAFFESKVAIPRLCEGAYRPGLPMMIMHATINQKWHALYGYDAEAGRLASPRRLIWSIDFDLMVRNMEDADWRVLLDHCAKNGVGPLVAEGLRGMALDLGTECREDILSELERDPVDPVLMAYFADPDGLGQFWIDLRKTRTFDEKRRLVTMRAFPPRDHLMRKYPQSQGWPTLALQGRLLVETAGRVLRKAISQ